MHATRHKRRKSFVAETISSWSDAQQLHEQLEKENDQWIFRGQTEWDWRLETTLERTLKTLGPQGISRSNIEGALLRRFKRQAHHYITDAPPDDNWLQWLALMQHYGAPTRLLDWTHSFFVGLYFAIEGGGGCSALWALNKDWATRSARSVLPRSDWKQLEADQNLLNKKTFEKLFARKSGRRLRYVLPVNPYRLNQRLAIQQGIFVCPGDISATFEENLAAMPSPMRKRGTVLKVRVALDRDARSEVIQRLFRMNVTPTTLFPGLDGFSRSLRLMMVFRNTLVPDTDWPVEGPRWPAKTPASSRTMK